MNLHQLIGIGLRHPHVKQVLAQRPAVGFFEVHSENYFHQGGPSIDALCSVRENYPISLHGVGLSLGSSSLQKDHLIALKNLIERVQPFLISEHLSWSRVNGIYMPDLLPIPYTDETLEIICDNVNYAQEFLGREILIENPSSYIEYAASDQTEVNFLVTLCQRTGAKILLDVNNIFVSCENHDWNAKEYIDAIPGELVKEIHLAGHAVKTVAKDELLRVDTHDNFVCQEVWSLYAYTIEKIGLKPTLLEWDANIPDLETLIQEANKALNYFPVGVGSHEIA